MIISIKDYYLKLLTLFLLYTYNDPLAINKAIKFKVHIGYVWFLESLKEYKREKKKGGKRKRKEQLKKKKRI